MRLGPGRWRPANAGVRHAFGFALVVLACSLSAAGLPSLRASPARAEDTAHRAMRRHHACAAALALCLSYSEAVDCVAAGFAPSLRCGSCATLEALVPDEDIVKDCRSCCADDDKVTYVKARLEVCE